MIKATYKGNAVTIVQFLGAEVGLVRAICIVDASGAFIAADIKELQVVREEPKREQSTVNSKTSR